MTSPSNDLRPGIWGQAISFKAPRAAMRTSASSSNVSFVSTFFILSFLITSERSPILNLYAFSYHFFVLSSHVQLMTLCDSWTYLITPYFCYWGIKSWPGRVWLESVLIGMCYYTLNKHLDEIILSHFKNLQGISQAQPGYRFSHHVPPIPSFFSYICKSIFRNLWGIRIPRYIPE